MNRYIIGISLVFFTLIVPAGIHVKVNGKAVVIGNVDPITERIVKGSGASKTETRKVEPFEKLNLNVSADVRVRKGNQTQVRITADDNILPVILTGVKKGILTISARESYSTKTKIRMEIQTPMITRVTVNGYGNVSLDSVTDKELLLVISGAGDIRAIGNVETLIATINGSGDLYLKRLQAGSCKITINGSGDIEITVLNSLGVLVNGSGNVAYYGNPKKVNSKVYGTGGVFKKK